MKSIREGGGVCKRWVYERGVTISSNNIVNIECLPGVWEVIGLILVRTHIFLCATLVSVHS